MTRYRHTFDADVDNAEFAEIYDAWHDERPTRADVDDRPEAVVPKVVRADTPLLAALQAGAERGQG